MLSAGLSAYGAVCVAAFTVGDVPTETRGEGHTKSRKVEDMDNTTSSYETASSTLVSREVKRKRSGRARDKEIAAVMELIECIEREAGQADNI
ncbi:hypothetical protein MRX96_059486 [Rhipicephalus microplus]